MNTKVFCILFVLIDLAHIIHSKKYIGKGKNGKYFLISTKLGKNLLGSSKSHLHKKKILRTHKSKRNSLKYAKKRKLTKENTLQEAGNDYAEAGNNYAEEGNDVIRYAETLNNDFGAPHIGSVTSSTSPLSSTGKFSILFIYIFFKLKNYA